MENNKHNLLLTVIGVGTLLIALAGATFAYFSATDVAEVQTVTTSSMSLEVKVTDDSANVANIKPTTWSTVDEALENTDIAQVHFTVTGDSSTKGAYSIDMSASGLALNTGNDAANVQLKGGSLNQVKYAVYKVDGTSYSAVTGDNATGDLSSLTGDNIVPIEIISGAEISGELNDHYVIFVYIENDTNPQNQLQGLDFDIIVSGSASQVNE